MTQIGMFPASLARGDGPLAEWPLPIPLEPGAFPGARVRGADGQVYTSIRYPDPGVSPYTWVSFAQLAEDVRAGVFRVQNADILIRVGSGGTVTEGVRYNTLNDAFDYIGARWPTYRADWQDTTPVRIWVLIESGFVVREQLLFQNANMGHVTLAAEDAVVDVDCTFLTRQTNGAPENSHAFISALRGTTVPSILGVRFRAINPTSVPQDPAAVAIQGAYTPRAYGIRLGSGPNNGVVALRRQEFDGTAIAARPGGFNDFYVNAMSSNGSSLTLNGANLDDGIAWCMISRGFDSIQGSTLRAGAGTNSLEVIGGICFLSSTGAGADAVFPGVYGQDFRKTAGVDGSNDIRVSSGGIVRIGANVRGGTSQAPNLPTSNGIVFDLRSTAPTVWSGILDPATYTVATLPSAAANNRRIIHVSDGNGGSPCLAVSNNTNWLRIALGAAVSNP